MPSIVVITGPTCAGKSTLEKMLVKRGFEKIVSVTTRTPRPSETNGVDYRFESMAQFEFVRDNGHFAETVSFAGNFYGAMKQDFLDFYASGKSVVFVADPQGRDEIIQFANEHDIPVLPVFVTNPGNVIAQRFIERYTSEFTLSMSSSEKLQKTMLAFQGRLDVMLSEEKNWTGSDHPGSVTFAKFGADNAEAVVGRVVILADKQREVSLAELEA